MDTEIREWINMIWEYCQEHLAVVAAAAVVLLILVISFFLVCTARREDVKAKAQADELSAPEHEPKPAVEPADVAEQSTELSTADENPQAAELSEVVEPENEPESEPESVQATLSDSMMKQLMRQVEEVSAASGQKVESIELNIEKARLTIRYAEGSAEESDGAKPQPKCTFELQNSGVSGSGMSGAGARNSADARDFAEKSGNGDGAGNRAVDGAETRAGDETGGGDEQTEESVMPRKFGMENMNRAKSGRVYTEDELLSQIKD